MIDAMLGIGIPLGNRFMGDERLDEFTLITHTLRSMQIPEIVIRWAKGGRPQAVAAKELWHLQILPMVDCRRGHHRPDCGAGERPLGCRTGRRGPE
jgi:hypothetical protein